jgi:uracil-DNA glycosylase
MGAMPAGNEQFPRRFVRLLQHFAAAQVFNPWAERNADDLSHNGPAARSRRLRAHLSITPALVLVGEAPGYQGCRVTGIPFTSERLVIAGMIPRIVTDQLRLSTRAKPWSEPSATILWSALHELHVAERTVLWNVFPWHPHRARDPLSNRTPTRAECAQGLSILDVLLSSMAGARVFAVGRHAQRALRELGREAVMLRHPSQGGATQFRRALRLSLKHGG